MRQTLILITLAITLTTSAQENLASTIQQHAKEINTTAPDFKGFSFLDTMLQNKRIVLLGESSHGTEEYSQTKLQIIQYLHEKLGFKVLLFESPMTSTTYANIPTGTESKELLRNSLQSFWNTTTVARLFDYSKKNNIQLGGFDPQYVRSPYPALLYTHAFSNHPAIKNTLLQLDSRIAETLTQPRLFLSLKDSFSTAFATLNNQLATLQLSPLQQWIKQMMTTNISYYARIEEGDQRDSCMAKNIIWLAEHLYANEKIIIWAHNTHIDKKPNHRKMMGKLLAAHFKDQLYAVGLYMINGTTALNNGKPITVKEPGKGSLETVLAARGFKSTFIETKHLAFDRRIPTLHAGKDKQVLNPQKSFDAIILINGVHAAIFPY
ncbi:MAG: erythromycin esterase family protein [Niastella sp.]|nr:erythromycin esterase family protein [Niastella sp.]